MKLHFTILDNVLFAILQSVKRFEQSKGLDTALYKNYIFTENMLLAGKYSVTKHELSI